MRYCRRSLAGGAAGALVLACGSEDSVAPSIMGTAGSAAVAGAGGTPAGTAGTAAAGSGTVAGSAAAGAGSAGSSSEAGSGEAGAGVAGAGVAGVGAAGSTGAGAASAGTPSAGMTAGSPAGAGAAGSGGMAADPDCDISGLWAVRMLSVVQALSLEQCGNLYYYVEFAQNGSEVEVVDHFNCGIEGRGSSSSTFANPTLLGLMQTNSWVGRRGTMQKGADGTCEFQLEPYWYVLSADEAVFAPDPRNANMTLTQVQQWKPLPPPPVFGATMPPDAPGVLDIESDGFPGAAFTVTGLLSGIRHAAQRGVHSWLTNDRYRITPAVDWTEDLNVRADYVGEDVTYWVEGDQALWAGALPVRDAASARATLRFLGRDASDPRAAEMVVSADPAVDPDGAIATCANIREALPPISPLTSPQVCPCVGGQMCM